VSVGVHLVQCVRYLALLGLTLEQPRGWWMASAGERQTLARRYRSVTAYRRACCCVGLSEARKTFDGETMDPYASLSLSLSF